MNEKESELKISVKCSCGLITDFSDTIEPIAVTGKPKTIIDANCIKCGKEIKLYVIMQNERDLFKNVCKKEILSPEEIKKHNELLEKEKRRNKYGV